MGDKMEPIEFDYDCTIELDVTIRVAVHPGEMPYISHARPEMSHPGSGPEVEVLSVKIGKMDIIDLIPDSTLDTFTTPTPRGRKWEHEYHQILECAKDEAQPDD